jgi:hypothetical protein
MQLRDEWGDACGDGVRQKIFSSGKPACRHPLKAAE